MKFNMRIGDLEARSCDEHLLLSGEHDRIEIVRWNSTKNILGAEEKEHCYTVAYFNPSEDYWDLLCLPERYIEIIQDRKLQKLFNTLVIASNDFLIDKQREESID